jgi:hypothetical protein
MPKYLDTKRGSISQHLLFEIMEKRGRKSITINRTKDFRELQGMEFDISTEHTWRVTDKLFKLSNEYYGTIEYWWVIGLVNGKPTDAHCSVGDVLYIPRDPVAIAEVA